MRSQSPPNSCRQCGSTNYHRLFARDGGGVLRHNGLYQCSGCQLSFTRAAEWRGFLLGLDERAITPEVQKAAPQILVA